MRQDPARIYPEMDYESRNLVRTELELYAREWRLPEAKVAEKYYLLARAAAKNPAENNVKTHVGYYLLDEGWKELAQALNRRGSGLRHFRRIGTVKAQFSLLPGFGLFLPADLFGSLLILICLEDLYTPFQLGLAALLLIAPVVGGTVRLIHTVLNWVFPPQILPKIEFRNGIPLEAASMVVIPRS